VRAFVDATMTEGKPNIIFKALQLRACRCPFALRSQRSSKVRVGPFSKLLRWRTEWWIAA